MDPIPRSHRRPVRPPARPPVHSQSPRLTTNKVGSTASTRCKPWPVPCGCGRRQWALNVSGHATAPVRRAAPRPFPCRPIASFHSFDAAPLAWVAGQTARNSPEDWLSRSGPRDKAAWLGGQGHLVHRRHAPSLSCSSSCSSPLSYNNAPSPPRSISVRAAVRRLPASTRPSRAAARNRSGGDRGSRHLQQPAG